MNNIIFTRPFETLRMGGVTIFVKQLVRHLNVALFPVVNLKGDSVADFVGQNEISNATLFQKIIIRIKLLSFMLLFPFTLIKNDVKLIHANPSLSLSPLLRDAFFVLWGSCLSRKKVVFIHGWNVPFADRLRSNKILQFLFRSIYNQADVIFVLAQEFKQNLRDLGLTTRIIVETTMVDDDKFDPVVVEQSIEDKKNKKLFRILYLSRIEKAKGIYETLDAFELVAKEHDHLELVVAGDGLELEPAKHYAADRNMIGVTFVGYLAGQAKVDSFLNANVYILPSYYGEGMPISVLEAMAYGLPVITRGVGGLNDFFINGEHGFITNKKDAHTFAGYLHTLIADKELQYKIAKHNARYAAEHFMASKVVKRIEKIYSELLEEENSNC